MLLCIVLGSESLIEEVIHCRYLDEKNQMASGAPCQYDKQFHFNASMFIRYKNESYPTG